MNILYKLLNIFIVITIKHVSSTIRDLYYLRLVLIPKYLYHLRLALIPKYLYYLRLTI